MTFVEENSRDRRLHLLRTTAEELRELRAAAMDPERADEQQRIGAQLQRRFDLLAESLAADEGPIQHAEPG